MEYIFYILLILWINVGVIYWLCGCRFAQPAQTPPVPTKPSQPEPVRSQPAQVGLNQVEQKSAPLVIQQVQEKVVVKPTPVVKAQPLPVKKVVENEDDNVMNDVEFFKNPIVENRDFYRQLTSAQQKEFDQLFILQGPMHLLPSLNYIIDGDNHTFFLKVFNGIYVYRKIISLSLLQAIYQELIRLANQYPETLTLLHEAMIRTTYYRRKDPAFLNEAKRVAQLDVELHQRQLNTTKRYVHSYVRLAIILEKNKEYAAALSIVEDAIKRQLIDRTKGKYAERKNRILKKQSKEMN